VTPVDEREWLRVRRHLREHRHALGMEASRRLYPDVLRVAGTPLLSSPAWLPAEPVRLDAVGLRLDPDAAASGPSAQLDGGDRYSELVERLARPAVFDNRTTYRLLDADLAAAQPWMSFGLGRYFDSIDVGESLAHEYAAQVLGLASGLPRRSAVGSPVDPRRRPTNIAVSALTLRHDQERAEARFLLHRRDPAKVGHAGGLYQVLPVGIFQPATEHPGSVRNDFSLWRCLVRECAEELLGHDEAPADGGPLDYDRWPFAVDLAGQAQRGGVRAYCLGMGVDPLTLVTDLLCAVVVDAPVFDRLFAGLVSRNVEGELVGGDGGGPGLRFSGDQVDRLAGREPMQAAGAAALRLTWRHRGSLLAR